MEVFFNELFDYNFFCNKQLIEECLKLKEVSERSRKLFSHILNTHQIWNARLIGNATESKAWEIHSIEKWKDMHYENQRNTFEIITNTDDFENIENRLFINTKQDMLFHIINHSTHHRAQILMDFREQDIEPIALDYVFYKR